MQLSVSTAAPPAHCPLRRRRRRRPRRPRPPRRPRRRPRPTRPPRGATSRRRRRRRHPRRRGLRPPPAGRPPRVGRQRHTRPPRHRAGRARAGGAAGGGGLRTTAGSAAGSRPPTSVPRCARTRPRCCSWAGGSTRTRRLGRARAPSPSSVRRRGVPPAPRSAAPWRGTAMPGGRTTLPPGSPPPSTPASSRLSPAGG